jgi:hypothetical protein
VSGEVLVAAVIAELAVDAGPNVETRDVRYVLEDGNCGPVARFKSADVKPRRSTAAMPSRYSSI